MIGSDADYVSTVASELPGMPWEYYVAVLPLVVGMQLRNISLAKIPKVELVTPGRSAKAKAREILGDFAKDWE